MRDIRLKAVVLAAGKGKRLQPLTLTKPKHLLSVGGAPILQHILNCLENAGLEEVLIVVKHMKEQIIEWFSKQNFNIKIKFKEQADFLGTANAISLAEDFTGNQPFIVVNGDILLDAAEIKRITEYHEANRPFCTLGVKKVDDPYQYGVIEIENGLIKDIVEKPSPEETSSNFISTGVMCFESDVFEFIKRTPISKRGEYEITTTLKLAIADSKKIIPYEISSWWVDIGRPWDLLEANRHIIANLTASNKGVVEEGAHIKGKVVIGKGAVIRSGAYIEGPVMIDEEADIGPNCYIRPVTYIGKRVRIGNACEIKNSIILDGTHIGHLSYVGDSIIGCDVNFGAGTKIANLRFDNKSVKVNINGVKTDSGHRKLGAIIGDNVKTGIGVNIMPGVKIGPGSAIAPNITVWVDIPPYKLVNVKLDYIYTDWKP
ncbi:MAG: NTP transferase domain-containing protein [Candidatus Odinarchaeum yellowstonii]|uniref:NTP transferase domain-containing protein n=1 Tax=Odinarchaeota yellowstonii (strain LCB_4) TaxID=1841599 RepID=A0AAF0IAI5_ODILC|nr:MAG: NTP transferase domain-containing protein [Candidatus Odinarchaeum yellowstonii]